MLQHFGTAHEKAGKIKNHRQLEKFARLQIGHAQRNPTPRAIHIAPHQQHRNQHQQADHQQHHRILLPSAHRHPERHPSRPTAHGDVGRLADEERPFIAAALPGKGHRGGIHHHQAEAQHQHHQPQQRLIDGVAVAQDFAVEEFGFGNHSGTSSYFKNQWNKVSGSLSARAEAT